jgi:hypothetical protein
VICDGLLKQRIDETRDDYKEVIERIQKKYHVTLNNHPEVELMLMFGKDVVTTAYQANRVEEIEESETESED